MPISLLEQKKKRKLLLPILGGVMALTLIVLWANFFKKPAAPPLLPLATAVPPSQKINIDWETLKNPILEKLESFDVIPPLPGSYGRKNPFLPY